MLYDLWWWATRTRLGVAAALLLAVAVAGGGFAVAWWRVAGPERFETLQLDPRPAPAPAAAPVPTPTSVPGPADPAAPAPQPTTSAAGPEVWLLFSTGTGTLDAAEADAMRMPDGTSRASDRLTDVLMLLVVDPASGRTALLSIPRDTWRFDRGHRINATYAHHGVQALVDDVRDVTGLPVHHVVGVNMRGFVRAVDAAGGVVVATDRPLRDDYSHLPALPAGCWRLGGVDALAYVRSRHTETLVDGTWRPDTSASDFGRAGRQREVLGALWEQLRGPRLLTMLPTGLQIVGSDLTLDQGTTVADLTGLARAGQHVAAGTIESHLLPTYGRQIGRAAAQVVDDDRAAPILTRLQSWPPGPPPEPAPEPAATGAPAVDRPTTGPDAASPTPATPDPAETASTAPPDPAPRLDPSTCDPAPVPWQ